MIYKRRKIKKPEIDWIKFDSWEEADIYKLIKNNKLGKATGIEELKNIKLLSASPPSIPLYSSFKRWLFTIRARRYTGDFLIKKKDWTEVLLEYKSSWSEKKPDYRLRKAIFLFLHWEEYNFAELIKIRKWIYEYREYF